MVGAGSGGDAQRSPSQELREDGAQESDGSGAAGGSERGQSHTHAQSAGEKLTQEIDALGMYFTPCNSYIYGILYVHIMTCIHTYIHI